MGIFSDIVGGVARPIVDAVAAHTQGKLELKKLEIETKKALAEAQINAIREGRAQDSNWEIESIRNSGHKDEWVLFILSIPMVGVFIPGLSQFMLQGFAILDKTPSWYRAAVVCIYMATFGIRVWKIGKSNPFLPRE